MEELEDEEAEFLQGQRELEDGRVLQEVILYDNVAEVLLGLDFATIEQTLASANDGLLKVF